MSLNTIFKSRESKIILGIVWGIGLACIFRSACSSSGCVIYRAPDPALVRKKVYQKEEKCYQYKQQNTECTQTAISG
jgi:hypothetical protein